MSTINKTQLHLDRAEERQIVHRDYLAHCLRWSHIVRNAKMGETILDLGCADAPLAMMFYVNKFKPKKYVGVDIRPAVITQNQTKIFNFECNFLCLNLLEQFDQVPHDDYSIITCLEVIEHVERDEAVKLLKNIVSTMLRNESTLYLSTPCFNGEKAANHVYEWTYQELKELLESLFQVVAVHGTFCSQRDVKPVFNEHEAWVFDQLHAYYDSNLLSILLAPLHPDRARNCLWTLRRKP